MYAKSLKIILLLPLILHLTGCDWLHETEFQINGFNSEDRAAIETLLADIANRFNMQPVETPYPPPYEFAVYREPHSPIVQAITFGAHRENNFGFVDLRVFNRGWPYSPPPEFDAIKQALALGLEEAFQDRLHTTSK